ADLDTPHLIIHQAGAVAQRGAVFFGPPATSYVPALWLGLNRIGPAPVIQVQRDARGGAGDFNGLCECAHKNSPSDQRRQCQTVLRVFSIKICADTISESVAGAWQHS